MSNDAFVILPALPLILALACLGLALPRGVLAPGAAFNLLLGLGLAVVMAMALSQEGGERLDGRLAAEIVILIVEAVVALTSLFYFVSHTRALRIAVIVGLGVHVALATALLAFAISFANADFAWH